MPFAATLGIETLEATPELVRASVAFDDRLCTSGGVLHGGVVMALADSTGALCAFLNLPDGAAGTTTVESKTNFLRGVREGELTAVAAPLHVGRRTIVIQTEVRDERGKLVSLTTQTQAVLT